MNNFNENNDEMNKLSEIAEKCLKQVKNKLYFSFRSLSPVIYRMKVEYIQPGSGLFGTDAFRIYADPMNVIIRYKKSPDMLLRAYLHMMFHCIYSHPFLTKYGIDNGIWNIALDICAEAGVMRLEPKEIDGDKERESIIQKLKADGVKLFIPDIVYKTLQDNQNKYDTMSLIALFHMDDHVWLEQNEGNGGCKNGDDDDDDDDDERQNPNKKPQPQNGNGYDDQNDNDKDQNQDGDEGQNGNGNDDSSQNSQQNQNNNQNGKNKKKNRTDNQDDDSSGNSQKNKSGNNRSNGGNGGNGGNGRSQQEMQQKQQEWSDVARQVATDMQSFHQQGKDVGDTMQEIDYLTKDKMEYDKFLRQFSIMEEKMMVNQDEFDYMYYTYGLNGIQNPDGKKIDKKILLIEPLEYKEEKVIKDFVIAIDTSGSCQGDLVKKFINKTYSILKEQESFSSRVNIHIVQCDARVQNDTKITNMEEMELFMRDMKLYGFGGTDFRPVFEYVDTLIKKKEFDNLCGLIYFTDGYGTYPTKPTQYKTAFAFLEDYNGRDVPPWAMSVFWKEDEEIA